MPSSGKQRRSKRLYTSLVSWIMDVDFSEEAGSSSARPPFQQAPQQAPRGPGRLNDRPSNPSDFDIFSWYPFHQRCLRYFLDQAQHSDMVRTLATFVNILLPYQKRPRPIIASRATSSHSVPFSLDHDGPRQMGHGGGLFPTPDNAGLTQPVSLRPYVRRLIATGFDTPRIMEGFFGDCWKEGIGSMHEIERRNYLFAAKSGSWLDVKAEYDLSPTETVPFLQTLQNVTEEEIAMADKQWSEWLAMQDWMVGPRAPDTMKQQPQANSPHIKTEMQD